MGQDRHLSKVPGLVGFFLIMNKLFFNIIIL